MNGDDFMMVLALNQDQITDEALLALSKLTGKLNIDLSDVEEEIEGGHIPHVFNFSDPEFEDMLQSRNLLAMTEDANEAQEESNYEFQEPQNFHRRILLTEGLRKLKIFKVNIFRLWSRSSNKCNRYLYSDSCHNCWNFIFPFLPSRKDEVDIGSLFYLH